MKYTNQKEMSLQEILKTFSNKEVTKRHIKFKVWQRSLTIIGNPMTSSSEMLILVIDNSL